MHTKRFLHKLLFPVMHKKRLDTLILLINTLVLSKKLSLTGLGRNINCSTLTQQRSNIRRVDRFLGNKRLREGLVPIYKQYITFLIGNIKCPKIIVDWSQVPNSKNYLLRAALANQGRGITLYEEVHHESKLGNKEVQCDFLNTLKELLPDCKPIIITDAGFCSPWFKQVLKLGWDFVGRIRGFATYYDGESWKKCKGLYEQATIIPRCIENVTLYKKNASMSVNLVVIKKNLKEKSPGYKRKKGGGKDVLYYRNLAKEPWVIASSIPGKSWIYANRIIKIYKLRMQIEEGFRDLKHGFNLKHAYSKIKERVQILLLIAMLATLIVLLIGYIAEKKEWHYKFQTNSIKKRRVLSHFFLGCQLMKQKIKVRDKEFNHALQELQATHDMQENRKL